VVVVGREEEGAGAPVVVGPAGEEDAAGSRSRWAVNRRCKRWLRTSPGNARC